MIPLPLQMTQVAQMEACSLTVAVKLGKVTQSLSLNDQALWGLHTVAHPTLLWCPLCLQVSAGHQPLVPHSLIYGLSL